LGRVATELVALYLADAILQVVEVAVVEDRRGQTELQVLMERAVVYMVVVAVKDITLMAVKEPMEQCE
jgi:hypothetical protein